MAYPLYLIAAPLPAPEELSTLRRLLEAAFPRRENGPYLDALCGSSLPRVTAQRLGALALLPTLLEAAGIPAEEMILRRDGHGRPFCEAADGRAVGFDFNLSHSDAHVAGALLIGPGNVGLDVEEPVPPSRALPLIRRYCTEGEQALLGGMEEVEAASLFTRLWTVREALAKQDGRGRPLTFDGSAIPAGLWLWSGRLPDTGAALTVCAPAKDRPARPCVLSSSLPVTLS